jgi:hypothetical protein
MARRKPGANGGDNRNLRGLVGLGFGLDSLAIVNCMCELPRYSPHWAYFMCGAEDEDCDMCLHGQASEDADAVPLLIGGASHSRRR